MPIGRDKPPCFGRYRKCKKNAINSKPMLNEFDSIYTILLFQMAFGLNLDSVNGSKNEFNKVVGDSLQGFHRITFDPFIMVITQIDKLMWF